MEGGWKKKTGLRPHLGSHHEQQGLNDQSVNFLVAPRETLHPVHIHNQVVATGMQPDLRLGISFLSWLEKEKS